MVTWWRWQRQRHGSSCCDDGYCNQNKSGECITSIEILTPIFPNIPKYSGAYETISYKNTKWKCKDIPSAGLRFSLSFIWILMENSSLRGAQEFIPMSELTCQCANACHWTEIHQKILCMHTTQTHTHTQPTQNDRTPILFWQFFVWNSVLSNKFQLCQRLCARYCHVYIQLFMCTHVSINKFGWVLQSCCFRFSTIWIAAHFWYQNRPYTMDWLYAVCSKHQKRMC